ncbi:NAD(P)/FAD-dependent oxidoreductase [Actinoplanes digitatis]|uniref:Uncharacterized protein n=1 Tax=Actinoplanes digitatis TaxID=1868 RepID=A0A7W7MNX5_9ACTN|nr:hypothetical protein [Actinoplanes digitatis]
MVNPVAHPPCCPSWTLGQLPGLRERWGREVPHCPYCHGHEVRGRAIGVLGSGPMSLHQALMWRQWSDDVTLFVHEAPEPDAEQGEQFAARGIAVLPGRVAEVVVEDDRLPADLDVLRYSTTTAPKNPCRAGLAREILALPHAFHPGRDILDHRLEVESTPVHLDQTAEEIIESLARICRRISGAAH